MGWQQEVVHHVPHCCNQYGQSVKSRNFVLLQRSIYQYVERFRTEIKVGYHGLQLDSLVFVV